ncbi:MAG: MATE family efflux transporter [Ruminococcaceae bacterium]|nr:MATE family efflux transporter [Oscillospiraceae bacterium]
MAQVYDLMQGKVSRLILSFYFPMLFTNLLQQIYNIADTAIVGKGLGDAAVAAVGNMGSLTFLVVGFSVGLTNGFSVSIAHSYGRKDMEELRRCIASSVVLSALITVILTVVSVVFLDELLRLLDTSSEIMSDSLLYGHILFGGLICTIFYNMCSAVLRALGDSKTPLIAIVVSSIVNVGLNYITIFLMDMGVDGPAYATIISQLISALICFARLRRIEMIRLHRSDFKVEIGMYLELIRNGIAMALMNSVTAVGSMVVQFFVNGLGLAYTSAFSVCMRYLNLFIDPACTAGFTMSAFTSQNYGAEKYSRIREGLRVCLTIAFVSYIIFGTVLVFFPKTIVGFMLNEESTIAIAAEYLPPCGIMLFAVDFLFVYRSGVQGMGYPLVPMLSGIAEMVMRILIVVLFVGGLGFVATAYAGIAAWVAALLMNMFAFYLILRRKQKQSITAK